MNNIFRFEWPVDQAGYEVSIIAAKPQPTHIDHPVFGRVPSYPSVMFGDQPERRVIKPKGGAARYYRPLEEHQGLFRQFAEQCTSVEGVLSFVNDFGFLINNNSEYEDIDDIIRSTITLRHIMNEIDRNNLEGAALEFNKITFGKSFAPTIIIPGLRGNDNGGFCLDLMPTNLWSALLLQAAGEIEHGKKFRRCKNCETWFHYGPGTGRTSRREFCSDRCRVTWGRRQREESGC